MQSYLHLRPQRARECVAYYDATGNVLTKGQAEIIDVGQGLLRVAHCMDASPCILPNAMLWARSLGRRVFPNECLALQGLPLRTREAYSEFSQSELQSLAGNAFCGTNVMAILLAVFSVYSWPMLVAP